MEMINSEVIKNESKLFYMPCVKILKIHIFHLKYTDENKYVVESPEIIIRKLLSIHIEKRKKKFKSFETC